MSQVPNPIFWLYSDSRSLDGSVGDLALTSDTSGIFNNTLYKVGYRAVNSAWEAGDGDPQDPLSLIDIPCLSEGPGLTACQIVCTGLDGTIYDDWQTFHMCLMLASLSLSVVRYPDFEDLLNHQLSGALSRIQSEPSNTDLASFANTSAIHTLRKVYSCAQAGCSVDGLSDECLIDGGLDLSDGDNRHNVLQWFSLFKSYCQNVSGNINNDLGGPGVATSYLLQAILALISWFTISLLTCRNALEFFAEPYLFLLNRRQHRKLTLESLSPRLCNFLRYMENSRVTHATICFLADFHEAQCFFVIVMSIAIIHAQDQQSAVFSGSDSWESLILNQKLLSILNAIGPLPLMLTQLALYSSQSKLSVYSLLCSTLAVIMAGVSSTQMQTLDVNEVQEQFRDTDDSDLSAVCFAKSSLRRFCINPYADGRPGGQDVQVSFPAITFPWLIAIGVLWLIKLKPRFSAMLGIRDKTLHKGNTFASASTSKQATARRSAGVMARWILRLGIPCTQLWLVIYIIANIPFLAMDDSLRRVFYKVPFSFVRDFVWPTSDIDWNIGQIITLLVWVPVLARHFYTLMFGIKEGFAVRLSDAYQVMRKPAFERHEVTNTDSESTENESSTGTYADPEYIDHGNQVVAERRQRT